MNLHKICSYRDYRCEIVLIENIYFEDWPNDYVSSAMLGWAFMEFLNHCLPQSSLFLRCKLNLMCWVLAQ